MKSAEFEDLNSLKPNTKLIKEFRKQRYILSGSPFWWSTDYAPDPKRYFPFEQFREKLVHLDACQTKYDHILSTGRARERDVYLYPEPEVPMSVLQLEVGENDLSFLVTARPYHEKEIWFDPMVLFIRDYPLESLPQYLKKGGVLNLPDHFYPHIRGLFAGKSENHLFWFPLFEGYAVPSNETWKNFGEPLHQALEGEGLEFVEIYDPPMTNGQPTYKEVWDELEEKGLTSHLPTWPDFSFTKVSRDEFLEGYQEDRGEYFLYYPLRLPQFKNTLPLVITTKTNEGNKIRKPVILGIYAENGRIGFTRRAGILRIRDFELAQEIAKAISEDFQTEIDAVLFTPQKGRPKYERVFPK